jgi:hypothetical protein
MAHCAQLQFIGGVVMTVIELPVLVPGYKSKPNTPLFEYIQKASRAPTGKFRVIKLSFDPQKDNAVTAFEILADCNDLPEAGLQVPLYCERGEAYMVYDGHGSLRLKAS